MKKVLVLCTGNSCRSQMAEGYLRHFAGAEAQAYSAGLEVHGVNPLAIAAMQKDGIDISLHTSNLAEEYAHVNFDMVITVCDHASELCPYFPGNVQRFHHDFPDPAKAQGSEGEIMNEFCRVRDLIKEYCKDFSDQHL